MGGFEAVVGAALALLRESSAEPATAEARE